MTRQTISNNRHTFEIVDFVPLYNNNPSKLLGLFFIAIIILQIKNTLVNNITKVSNKILD